MGCIEPRTGAPSSGARGSARAIHLPSVPFLGAFSVGIARKRPRPAPDHRALVEGTDDLRRLGVDQARRIELLVRVVPVPPAVGEPLPEPGAGDLAAQLGPEAAAERRASRSATARSMVAQLRLDVTLRAIVVIDASMFGLTPSRSRAQSTRLRPRSLLLFLHPADAEKMRLARRPQLEAGSCSGTS